MRDKTGGRVGCPNCLFWDDAMGMCWNRNGLGCTWDIINWIRGAGKLKVTRYICDRCGKEVSMIERTSVEIRDIAAGQQIDLCPECAEAMDRWLEQNKKDGD